MFYGWRVVATCFVAAACTWGFGVFGGSVYLAELRDAHGWSTALISSALTVFFLANGVSVPFIGRAIDRWGPRFVIAGGAAMLAAGVAAVGRLEASWQLFPAFAVMGLGYATMSVTGLSATIAPWFERHQGRSVSLALTGASVGAMVVTPGLVFAIAALGFADATLAAGFLTLAVMTPLALIVFRPRGPEAFDVGRDGDPILTQAETPKTSLRSADAHDPLAVWTVAGGFALGLLVQVGFLTHHYALAAPMLGAKGAGILVGATGAAGLIGRLTLAKVIDGVDPRRYSMGVFAIQTCVFAVYAVWPSVEALIPVSLIYGFCLGQITTLSPIVIRREVGAAAFGAVYGVAGAVIQFSSAFGPAFYGLIVTALGGYAGVLGVAAGFKLAAIAVLYLGRPAAISSSAGRSPRA